MSTSLHVDDVHALSGGIIAALNDAERDARSAAPAAGRAATPAPRVCLAGQALCVIEGERKAHEFLARLHAQQSDPDELALIVARLYGATLRGFARVLSKALAARGA